LETPLPGDAEAPEVGEAGARDTTEQSATPGAKKKTSKEDEMDESEALFRPKHENKSRMFKLCHVKFPFPIAVLVRCSMAWEILMFFVIWQTTILVTFMCIFSFADTQDDESILGIFYSGTTINNEDLLFILDCFFLFDVMLRLFVEVWRAHSGILCIVFVLQYTFTTLVVDMITIFPYDLVFIHAYGSREFKSIRLVNYIRCMKLLRFYRIKSFFGKLTFERNLCFLPIAFTIYQSMYHPVPVSGENSCPLSYDVMSYD
jgi:hypothetical protein